MADYTLTESDVPEFTAIPANSILEAEVVSVTEQESFFWVDDNDHDLGKKMQVSFRFKVTGDYPYTVEVNGEKVEGNALGRTLFGNTPTTFTTHPDCKLRVWVQEILGVDELPKGFSLTADDDSHRIEALEGAQVKVVVGNYNKKNKDGSITVKDTVSDVIRVGGFADAIDLF